MASDFGKAVKVLLAHEGGFIDDPDDPGGATNFGISLRYLKENGDIDGDGILDFDIDIDGKITAEDIKLLSQEDAEHIYYHQFWLRNNYNNFVYQDVATKMLDLAVNMGARQANKCLQRALRSSGRDLLDDGIVGGRTIFAINSVGDSKHVLNPLRSEAAGIYRQIVAKNSTSRKYINGWLKRAYS